MSVEDEIRSLARGMQKMGQASMTAVGEQIESILQDEDLPEDELIELIVSEMEATREAAEYASDQLRSIHARLDEPPRGRRMRTSARHRPSPSIGPTLRPSDLQPGLRIVNKEHPDWGTWVVLRHYSSGTWEIRGRSGTRTLDEGEAHFWAHATH